MKDNVSTQIRLPANLHAWMKQEAKRIRTQSVMEIKVAKDPDQIEKLFQTGNWIVLNGANERGTLKLLLGRVTPDLWTQA